MKRFVVLILSALLVGGAAFPVVTPPPAAQAQKKAENPYVRLPGKKTAKPNRYFCLKPDATNCTNIKWIIPAGLDKLDPEIPVKDSNVAVLIGDSGTYTVQAYGALGDQASDIASCVVTIGTPPPPIPPTPPVPPSPLTAALQAAYNLDTDSDKANSLAFLQSVYAGLESVVPSWTDVKTNADALAKIKAVVQTPGVGLNATQVQNLRKAIAADFAKVFGTTGTTPITLAALGTEIAAVANALKGVK